MRLHFIGHAADFWYKDRNARGFYLCSALVRKQLRRYFQLASAGSIPSGRNSIDPVVTLHKWVDHSGFVSTNTHARFSHRRVEECINTFVSNEDLLLSPELGLTEERCSQLSVNFADDLANVLDEFAVSNINVHARDISQLTIAAFNGASR